MVDNDFIRPKHPAHYFCSYFLLLHLLFTIFFFLIFNFVPISFYLHLLFYIFFFPLFGNATNTRVRGRNTTRSRQTRRNASSAELGRSAQGGISERERVSWAGPWVNRELARGWVGAVLAATLVGHQHDPFFTACLSFFSLFPTLRPCLRAFSLVALLGGRRRRRSTTRARV